MSIKFTVSVGHEKAVSEILEGDFDIVIVLSKDSDGVTHFYARGAYKDRNKFVIPDSVTKLPGFKCVCEASGQNWQEYDHYEVYRTTQEFLDAFERTYRYFVHVSEGSLRFPGCQKFLSPDEIASLWVWGVKPLNLVIRTTAPSEK
ncbi:hypothetical protein KC926_01420 [Candidatus Kaiserbacteria bacterium]|nr:hypothetical protein [Candidatus Kaiserbacteria bacterium]